MLKKLIALLIIGGISLVHTLPAFAAPALKETSDGAKLYTYQTSCTPTDTNRTEYGIIIPTNANSINSIYLYFHGLGNPDPQKICESFGLCRSAARLAEKSVSSAILIPEGNSNDGKKNKDFDASQMQCFINEALRQLNSVSGISAVNSSNLSIAAHSDGWRSIKVYLQSGRTAKSTILLDACYASGCESIVGNTNSGQVYLYAGNDREPNFGTLTNARQVYSKFKASDRVKLVEIDKTSTGIVHDGIPSRCFADSVYNDSCGFATAGQTSTEEQVRCMDKSCLTQLEQDLKLTKPSIEINVPQLNFGEITETEDASGKRYFYIPWIGQYLTAAYKFLLVVASIIAVIMIIVQGATVIISAGGEQKNTAYKKILQAIIGLFICWGSYIILYTINPDLVNFKSLRVEIMKTRSLSDIIEQNHDATSSDTADQESGGSTTLSGDSIVIAGTGLTVQLSKTDTCLLRELGSTSKQIAANMRGVKLFGSKLTVHKYIADDLQKKFDQLNVSTNPDIVSWKEHLLSQSAHKGIAGLDYTRGITAVNGSGAFSPTGHIAERIFIDRYGEKYGVKKTMDGIVNALLVAYIKRKMYDEGIREYINYQNKPKKLSYPKSVFSRGSHDLGMAFDIDFPHNPTGKKATPPNGIPQAAADIITSGGEFVWGNDFKPSTSLDPAHFEYIGSLCK